VTHVETVTGPPPVHRLGRTLMHEHAFVTSPEVRQSWPGLAEGRDVAGQDRDALANLAAAKRAGIDTIVDLTVLGLGRDVPRVARIAARSEMTILVATGATCSPISRCTSTSGVRAPR
jgi:phosphotriesterase-related protein